MREGENRSLLKNEPASADDNGRLPFIEPWVRQWLSAKSLDLGSVDCVENDGDFG